LHREVYCAGEAGAINKYTAHTKKSYAVALTRKGIKGFDALRAANFYNAQYICPWLGYASHNTAHLKFTVAKDGNSFRERYI
jgi:hypothetical protein